LFDKSEAVQKKGYGAEESLDDESGEKNLIIHFCKL